MIVLFPTVMIVAVVLVWRAQYGSASAAAEGWRWFTGWSLAGAALTLSFLGMFTIGLLILPVALALLIWVARSAPRPAEAIGFVEGIGWILLLIAFLNRDYAPCAAHGVLSLPAGSPPGSSVSCGGLDPTPWFVAGIAVSGIALLAYALLRRRKRSVQLPGLDSNQQPSG
jgi:hypothetical protein